MMRVDRDRTILMLGNIGSLNNQKGLCLPASVTDTNELTMCFWSLSGFKELRSGRVAHGWLEKHYVHSKFLDPWRRVR